MIVIDQRFDSALIEWLDKRCPGFGSVEGTIRTIALIDSKPGELAQEEDVLAVAALSRWTAHTCEATLAVNSNRTPNASRLYVWSVFDYVFNQCNKSSLYTFVSADNVRSIRLQHRLGFKKKAVLTDHFGTGNDAILFAITKDEWQSGRWASQQ